MPAKPKTFDDCLAAFSEDQRAGAVDAGHRAFHADAIGQQQFDRLPLISVAALPLGSEWREEDKRNKRFYRLSKEGAHILKQLIEEWQSMNSSLKRIV